MSTPDVFNVDAQSKYISNLGVSLSKNIKDGVMKNKKDALNPISAIESLEESLRSSGVSAEYMEAVEELKTDKDILKALEHFEKSLNGEVNIHEMRNIVPPDVPEAESKPTIDVGLNGEVFTGAIDDNGDNDLIRYSNYISGAGTTFGGFMTDIPSTLHDLIDQSLDVPLRDFNKWNTKMENAHDNIPQIMQDEIDFHEMFGDNPRRMIDRSRTADMQSKTTKQSLADIEARTHLGKKNIAVAQHELYSKKMVDVSTKRAGAFRAKNMLGRVSNKIGVATAAFGVAQGGVDIAAGDQMLANAKEQLKNGKIDQDEYDRIKRDAQLRITGGAFGLASGVHDIGKIVKGKIGKTIAQKLASPGITLSKSTTKLFTRFATVVGGALSIGMGMVSITKNAIAADSARQSKNYGRMAMYGVMAALDCVSVVLDAVSIALDFMPGIGTAISFVVDLVNTVVGLVNMVIGFFADLVDTRSDEVKVTQAFNEYVESNAFKDYIDRQAAVYKDQGYDIFQFIIDAESVGVHEDDFDSSKVDKIIIRKLTDSAVKDSTNKNLRIALRDASSIGRELHGRCGDDLIMAGVGADTVYGEEGDDLLYGESGDNTLYGGPGNDYLNGGTGRNELFGGKGDDWMVIKPGIEKTVDGGPGSDTVEISIDFFNWYDSGDDNTIKFGLGKNEIQGCYVDLSRQTDNQSGRAGLSLGALVNDISELDRPIHKKAFETNSILEKNLSTLFWPYPDPVQVSNLKGKMFWYLAHEISFNTDLKYFTDGKYIYAKGEKHGVSNIWRGTFVIQDIPLMTAWFDEKAKNLKYTPGKELEALLLLAYRGTKCVRNVEKVVESQKGVDIHTQFIGDNKTNLINIMYGYNEYVYTGNGDNVVIMASSYSPPFKMWKYIIGGDGDNTLIINSSNHSLVQRDNKRGRYDVGYLFMLLDADIEFDKAKKVTSVAWSGEMVDRGIYLKNIKRIQLSAKFSHNASYHVDATNLREGHTFIVDSDTEGFRLLGTQGDDAIFIKNLALMSSLIDGNGGTNLITLENYASDDNLTVSLPTEYSEGHIRGRNLSAILKNIHSVKGSHNVISIEGNDHDNLLIACGGSTKVHGKGGRNTLVSMRGCHTFEGSDNGINTYVINGPEITEIMTITVTNVHKKGLKASSLHGVWENGILTIDILKDEPSAITLKKANIVDTSGNIITNKGRIDIVKSSNKLYFQILDKFNNLADNRSETIRIKYTTEGSTATINEPGNGSLLRLTNFSSASELKIFVNSDNDLEFQTLSEDTILVDKYWGKAFKEGLTNPISLISNFGRRFQMIVFDKSQTHLDFKGVISMLFEKLSTLVNNPTNNYDHMVDLASVTQKNMTQYTVGSGNNQILLNVRNIKLILGNGRNLVDMSRIPKLKASHNNGTVVMIGSGKTTLILEEHTEYVTVHGSSDSAISLILKNMNHNSLVIHQSNGPVYYLIYNGLIISVLKGFTPRNMYFLNKGVMVLIDDVPNYIKQRTHSRNYIHRLELHSSTDGKSNLTLNIPNVSSSDVEIILSIIDKRVKVMIFVNDQKAYEFLTNTTKVDTDYIAMFTRYQLRGGIEMSDGTKAGEKLQEFVKSKVGSSFKPSGFANVLSISNENVRQLTLTSSDDLVVADVSGCVVNTSGGKDFVRVSASGVKVKTGKDRDTVFVQAGAQNVSIKFKADDNWNAKGRNTLVLEGITGNGVTLTDLKDEKHMAYIGDIKGKPVKFWNGANVIAKVDTTPICIMFKNGDEYEVIKFFSVPKYIDEQAYNKYTPRNYMTANGKMYFKMTDVSSDDFQVLLKRYSPTQASLLFDSTTSRYLYEYQFQPDSNSVSATDMTLQVAAEMPGGIQFQDVTKKGGNFLLFLLNKIIDSTKTGITVTSTTWSENEAMSALDSFLKKNNPNSDYITIAANVAFSLSI